MPEAIACAAFAKAIVTVEKFLVQPDETYHKFVAIKEFLMMRSFTVVAVLSCFGLAFLDAIGAMLDRWINGRLKSVNRISFAAFLPRIVTMVLFLLLLEAFWYDGGK